MNKVGEAIKNYGCLYFEVEGMREDNPFSALEEGIYKSPEGYEFQIAIRGDRKFAILPGDMDLFRADVEWLDSFFTKKSSSWVDVN